MRKRIITALGATALALMLSSPIQGRADIAAPHVPEYGNQSSSESFDVGSGTLGEVNCLISQALTESPEQTGVPGPVNTLTARLSTSCPIPSGNVTLQVTLDGPTPLTTGCTSYVNRIDDAHNASSGCSVDRPAVGRWEATYQASIEVYTALGPNDTVPSGCSYAGDSFTAYVNCTFTLDTDIALDTEPLFSSWYPPPL